MPVFGVTTSQMIRNSGAETRDGTFIQSERIHVLLVPTPTAYTMLREGVRRYACATIVPFILQVNIRCLDVDSVRTTTTVLWGS